MFLENNKHKGWIEVVCGSMFSGKTEELIRRMKRAQFANLKVEIFKPSIDVRYSNEDVVSHDANAIHSTPVESAQNILLMATAEYVTKVHAICVRCGDLAHHSHRLTADDKQVLLGAKDTYQPICRHCFNELMNKK